MLRILGKLFSRSVDLTEWADVAHRGNAFKEAALQYQQEKQFQGVETAVPLTADPSILLSSNIHDAILFRDEGVKAVHIKQEGMSSVFNQAHEFGFEHVAGYMMLVPKHIAESDFEKLLKGAPGEYEELLTATREVVVNLKMLSHAVLGETSPLVEGRFHSSKGICGAYVPHFDNWKATISSSCVGAGLKYYANQNIDEEQWHRYHDEECVDEHAVMCVQAGPGDIVLSKGVNGNKRLCSDALLHESGDGDRLAFVAMYE